MPRNRPGRGFWLGIFAPVLFACFIGSSIAIATLAGSPNTNSQLAQVDETGFVGTYGSEKADVTGEKDNPEQKDETVTSKGGQTSATAGECSEKDRAAAGALHTPSRDAKEAQCASHDGTVKLADAAGKPCSIQRMEAVSSCGMSAEQFQQLFNQYGGSYITPDGNTVHVPKSPGGTSLDAAIQPALQNAYAAKTIPYDTYGKISEIANGGNTGSGKTGATGGSAPTTPGAGSAASLQPGAGGQSQSGGTFGNQAPGSQTTGFGQEENKPIVLAEGDPAVKCDACTPGDFTPEQWAKLKLEEEYAKLKDAFGPEEAPKTAEIKSPPAPSSGGDGYMSVTIVDEPPVATPEQLKNLDPWKTGEPNWWNYSQELLARPPTAQLPGSGITSPGAAWYNNALNPNGSDSVPFASGQGGAQQFGQNFSPGQTANQQVQQGFTDFTQTPAWLQESLSRNNAHLNPDGTVGPGTGDITNIPKDYKFSDDFRQQFAQPLPGGTGQAYVVPADSTLRQGIEANAQTLGNCSSCVVVKQPDGSAWIIPNNSKVTGVLSIEGNSGLSGVAGLGSGSLTDKVGNALLSGTFTDSLGDKVSGRELFGGVNPETGNYYAKDIASVIAKGAEDNSASGKTLGVAQAAPFPTASGFLIVGGAALAVIPCGVCQLAAPWVVATGIVGMETSVVFGPGGSGSLEFSGNINGTASIPWGAGAAMPQPPAFQFVEKPPEPAPEKPEEMPPVIIMTEAQFRELYPNREQPPVQETPPEVAEVKPTEQPPEKPTEVAEAKPTVKETPEEKPPEVKETKPTEAKPAETPATKPGEAKPTEVASAKPAPAPPAPPAPPAASAAPSPSPAPPEPQRNAFQDLYCQLFGCPPQQQQAQQPPSPSQSPSPSPSAPAPSAAPTQPTPVQPAPTNQPTKVAGAQPGKTDTSGKQATSPSKTSPAPSATAPSSQPTKVVAGQPAPSGGASGRSGAGGASPSAAGPQGIAGAIQTALQYLKDAAKGALTPSKNGDMASSPCAPSGLSAEQQKQYAGLAPCPSNAGSAQGSAGGTKLAGALNNKPNESKSSAGATGGGKEGSLKPNPTSPSPTAPGSGAQGQGNGAASTFPNNPNPTVSPSQTETTWQKIAAYFTPSKKFLDQFKPENWAKTFGFIQSAPAAPHDPLSGQELADAINSVCKIQGCNAKLMTQAMGGVCAIESQCNAHHPHPGSQYQGFGQLGWAETGRAINKLYEMSQSPSLSPEEQTQMRAAADAARAAQGRGQNPNQDLRIGPWMLVGLHAALGTLPKVSAVTNDPMKAAAYLENAQLAPDTFSGNFYPGKPLSLGRRGGLWAYNVQGWMGEFAPGTTVEDAAQRMLGKVSGKMGKGVEYAGAFSPRASPAPIPPSYEGVASAPPSPQRATSDKYKNGPLPKPNAQVAAARVPGLKAIPVPGARIPGAKAKPSDRAASDTTVNLPSGQARIYTPAGFNKDQPFDVVYYLSGLGGSVDDSVVRQKVFEQCKGANVVCVIPDMGVDGPTSAKGPLGSPEKWKKFAEELNQELRKQGIEAANAAIDIVAYSGGYYPASKALEGLGSKVKSLEMIDGMYQTLVDAATKWIKANPGANLTSTFTNSDKKVVDGNKALMDAIRGMGIEINPDPSKAGKGVNIFGVPGNHSGLVQNGNPIAALLGAIAPALDSSGAGSGEPNSLAGLPLRYMIGGGSCTAGAACEVGYNADASACPDINTCIAYGNLYDENQTDAYGPYRPKTPTARQYRESVPDQKGPGFEKNIRDQAQRRKAQGFKNIEWDNVDGYTIADAERAFDIAAEYGLNSVLKNPGLNTERGEDASRIMNHPNLAAIVCEKESCDPAKIDALRQAAGRPNLPVWFVGFGSEGGWTNDMAAAASRYPNMSVTQSDGCEYCQSKDVGTMKKGGEDTIGSGGPVATNPIPEGRYMCDPNTGACFAADKEMSKEEAENAFRRQAFLSQLCATDPKSCDTTIQTYTATPNGTTQRPLTRDEAMQKAKDYLFEVYQRTPVKKDGSGDFTWKDPAAAKRAGMDLAQYVIGGLNPDLILALYEAGQEMDKQGINWSMLSAFRDEYRQRIAEGFKGSDCGSMHSGGNCGMSGYGKGRAVDVASSEAANWLAANGAKYGLSRPMPGDDPWHIQINGGNPNAGQTLANIMQNSVPQTTYDVTSPDGTETKGVTIPDLKNCTPNCQVDLVTNGDGSLYKGPKGGALPVTEDTLPKGTWDPDDKKFTPDDKRPDAPPATPTPGGPTGPGGPYGPSLANGPGNSGQPSGGGSGSGGGGQQGGRAGSGGAQQPQPIPPQPLPQPVMQPIFSPTLSCAPQTAQKGLVTLITVQWSCSGNTAIGTGFDTAGQSTGQTGVTIASNATADLQLSLQCTAAQVSTSTSCAVKLIRTNISLVANPKTVVSGNSTRIGWAGGNISRCKLYQPPSTLFGQGGSSGMASTSPLTRNSMIGIACDAGAGFIATSSIPVMVVGDTGVPLPVSIPANPF